MGKGEVCTGFWWGSLRERDRWGDQDVDWTIKIGWNFRKWDVGVRTGLGCLRIGIVGGRFECGEAHSCSIKQGEFLD
jgi:hypothetical protein